MVDRYHTPMVKSERNYIDKLIYYLKDNNYVFTLGAPGSGATTIIKSAKTKIEKSIGSRVFYFNLKEESSKGAHCFYRNIINKVAGKELKNKIDWKIDLSNDFIEKLLDAISITNESTVLIFYNFRAINIDFFDHFTRDCRKIYHLKEIDNKSQRNKLLMVFSGSMISTEGQETSPLWNITKKIEITPVPENEVKTITCELFEKSRIKNTSDDLKSLIYKLTKGHRYMIRVLFEYLERKPYQDTKNITENLLDDLVDYIWSYLYVSNDQLKAEEIKLQEHFLSIIEYLETSPKILRIIIDLHRKKQIQGPKLPKIDDITITGVVTKNRKGSYYFSNPIYERFFDRLIHDHRLGEFCLLHPKEKDLWEKAKNIYLKFYDRGKKSYPRIDDKNGKRNIRRLMRNLLVGLRSFSKSEEFTYEFSDMISLVFNLRVWTINKIVSKNGKRKLGQPDTLFEGMLVKKEAILKNDMVNLDKFIRKVLKTQYPMFDWTGQWFAVPVIIGEEFARLILIKLEPYQREMVEHITSFVQESLTAYYNVLSKEIVREELEKLKKRLDLLKGRPGVGYRRSMSPIWTYGKKMFEGININNFSIYEIIDDEKVICTKSTEDVWAKSDSKKTINDYPILESSLEQFKKGINLVYDNENEKILLCEKMLSGAKMIFEISKDHIGNTIRGHEFRSAFEFMKCALNIGWDLQSELGLYENVLSGSEDYLYVVDKKRHVLFANKRLRELAGLPIDTDLPENLTCHNLISGNDVICDECKLSKAFENREPFHVFHDFPVYDGNIEMDTNFVPVIGENDNSTIAVAVYMHDLRDWQRLWRALEAMEKIDEIEKLERFILKRFIEFGFSRVFSFNPDSRITGHFISHDLIGPVSNETKRKEFINGKIKFKTKDNDLLEGRVSIWFRRAAPNDKLRSIFEDRFRNSGFLIKDSIAMPKHDPKKLRPNVWINVPFSDREGNVKLYSLDNWRNEKKDIDLFSLEKCQVLETFARAAGQIFQNVTHRSYLKQLQMTLTHGTMEPLQTLRNMFYYLQSKNEIEEIKDNIGIIDATLEMAQNTLQSLLSVERGSGRIIKKQHNISTELKNQMSIFRKYAQDYANIKFDLDLPQSDIYFSTDITILLQILNNLIGNSIRHLKSPVVEQKFKLINIDVELKSANNRSILNFRISDNGNGLPASVIEYFNKPFNSGTTFPTSGLGLGLSREMANILGGSLNVINPPLFGKGVTFNLSIH